MADAQRLATALTMYETQNGVAPFGLRHSGEGVKGHGYFGLLPHQGGSVSSELSTESDINGKNVEHPLIVPTLNANELQHLLSGNEPTPEIIGKSQSWAADRIRQGKSPFASPNELRYPVPTE